MTSVIRVWASYCRSKVAKSKKSVSATFELETDQCTPAAIKALDAAFFGDNYFSVTLVKAARTIEFEEYELYELELALNTDDNDRLWIKPTRECLKSIKQGRKMKPYMSKSKPKTDDDDENMITPIPTQLVVSDVSDDDE